MVGREGVNMRDELVSVRMLIAWRTASERDLWHEAIGLAAVPIELTEVRTVLEARPALERGDIGLVLIEAGVREPDRSAICQAARTAPAQPTIVVSAVADADALGVDADGLVTRPSTLAEAGERIARMLRSRLRSKVLIVDDSGTMRRIVRNIQVATTFPLEIAEAAEGGAALERLREENFDIIVLDYNIPGLNGLETLAEIKREHPQLEVVMISATQDETLAARVLAGGAAAFLKKPFFPPDVDAVLQAYCGLRPLPRR
jgi:CheY-like chemotaxis protein